MGFSLVFPSKGTNRNYRSMAAAKNGTGLARGVLIVSRFVMAVSHQNPEFLRHV